MTKRENGRANQRGPTFLGEPFFRRQLDKRGLKVTADEFINLQKLVSQLTELAYETYNENNQDGGDLHPGIDR